MQSQGAVAEGIAAYEEMLDIGGSRHEVSSGRAAITNLEMTSHGQTCSVLQYGEGLQMHIDCNIAPEITSFNVILHFLSRSGDAVAEANSFTEPEAIRSPGGSCRLTIDLGRIPLAPGRYSTAVTLLGGQNAYDHLCVLQHGCELRVEGAPVGNAPLLFPATFSMQTGGHGT